MKNKAKRRSGSSRSTAASTVEFNPDYTHITRDLKRIGTLAGIFIVTLIVLAFVMPYIMP